MVEVLFLYNLSERLSSSNTQKIGQVLSAYEDSAFIYRNYVKLVERRYGLKFYHEKNGNTYKFLLKAERIDSALMLLPYFRDRLTYNAKKEYWEIETTRGLFDPKENRKKSCHRFLGGKSCLSEREGLLG